MSTVKMALKDIDRLHDIALALDGFVNLLGTSDDEENDKLCCLIEKEVEDLIEIEERIVPIKDDAEITKEAPGRSQAVVSNDDLGKMLRIMEGLESIALIADRFRRDQDEGGRAIAYLAEAVREKFTPFYSDVEQRQRSSDKGGAR